MDFTIVSPLPQTTRNHFQCVMTIDKTEIIFIDTPGFHKSNKELNIRMNQESDFATEGAELVLFLVDSAHRNFIEEIKESIELWQGWNKPIPHYIVFTKTDLVTATKLQDKMAMFKELIAQDEKIIKKNQMKFFAVSVKEEENLHLLTGALLDAAESGPHLFPQGELSNKNTKFFVSEYIREQVYYLLKEELPYEVAVIIEEFLEPRVRGQLSEGNAKNIVAKITASILVNRPSQRSIVVGAKGAMIKEIGTRARKKIETLLGGQVFLNLHVKISPNWNKNNFILEEIGLPRAKNSHRVWRQK